MQTADVGLIGLGTMGAMLALNIADKGFSVAVHNRTSSKIPTFLEMAGPLADRLFGYADLQEFVAGLSRPRHIILMVPAGDAVDAQIAQLRPLLDADDMIIDAGNANFHETQRRAAEATKAGYPFLGIGVSGGAEGARFGPSIMGGGTQDAWDRVSHVLNAIAAKHEGQPCATYMGTGGAGHFVKTVHNGIEYADMQLIAEVYGIMRDGFGKDAASCGTVFDAWNTGLLQSYLIEISGKVAAAKDPETETAMLDLVLDRAGQKGTGRWTVIESQMLGSAVPVIEAAVAARNLSAARDLRLAGAQAFAKVNRSIAADALSLDDLEKAMIAGKVLCYAQGFALLHRASDEYAWDLPMSDIAKVWREGCIIRSSMLGDMADALADPKLANLVLAPYFKSLLDDNIAALRKVAVVALSAAQPTPALTAALTYFDTLTSARTTANMLQAQRDFFGAHGFERIDHTGTHHGPWLDQHLNG